MIPRLFLLTLLPVAFSPLMSISPPFCMYKHFFSFFFSFSFLTGTGNNSVELIKENNLAKQWVFTY